jgi:hypothetical protein
MTATAAQSDADTGLSEELETSTDVDENAIENIEIDLDELKDDDESDTDTKDEAATEPEEEVEEETKEDESEEPEDVEETQETEETEDETQEDKPLSKAEQKRLNDEYARRRIAEKQLKEEREARERDDLQRYLDEAQDDQEELARRELQVEKYNLDKEKAQIATEKLEIGLDRAISEIDLFRTGSDEVKEELANSLDDFERMYVSRDGNGNVVEVRADIHQYLKTKSESIRRLTGIGAQQEAKAKKVAKSRTDTPPTRTPKEPATDPYLEAFLEEANRG